jgi:prevent-host-death family protein
VHFLYWALELGIVRTVQIVRFPLVLEPTMPIDLSQAISTSEARERFSDLINRASFGFERVILTRRGKPVAAVVPFEDVEWLEKLDDEDDLRAIKEAKEEIARGGKTIAWEDLKRELGLE